MKKLLIICFLASSLVFTLKGHNLFIENAATGNDTIQVVTTQELYGLMELVFNNYVPRDQNATVRLVVKDKASAMLPLGENKLVLKSDPARGISNPDQWSLTIGRDILVPVVSKMSPYLNDLMNTGIKPSDYASILASENGISWGSITGSDARQKIHLIYSDKESSIDQIAAFAGVDNNEISISPYNGSESITASLIQNRNAIGFCRLTDMLNSNQNTLIEGLEIIPIDINENGTVDHFENYCGSYAELVRAVWIGKYPKSLFNELRLVAMDKPQDESTINFIAWVLTQGQNGLLTAELTGLQSSERRSALNTLYSADHQSVAAETSLAGISRGIYWVIGILLALFVAGIIVMLTSKRTDLNVEKVSSGKILDLSLLNAPAGLLFDKSHTWSYMEPDGMVKVGLADFMQHITGKISRIELKNVGDSVKRGQDLFTIVQDGKHLVIKSPVNAKIESVNIALENNSGSVNDAPYTEGWIYTMKPDNWMAEYNHFFIGETYTDWINKEFLRLKEFVTSAVFKQQTQGMQLVMQDGGEIIDNLLESMSPELWEEFQLGFINKAK